MYTYTSRSVREYLGIFRKMDVVYIDLKRICRNLGPFRRRFLTQKEWISGGCAVYAVCSLVAEVLR